MQILRCICNETRLGMLELLHKHKEMSVNDIVAGIKKNQPLVSHHLRKLRECGVVKTRSDAQKIIYRISSAKVARLISNIAEANRTLEELCDVDKSSKD